MKFCTKSVTNLHIAKSYLTVKETQFHNVRIEVWWVINKAL